MGDITHEPGVEHSQEEEGMCVGVSRGDVWFTRITIAVGVAAGFAFPALIWWYS